MNKQRRNELKIVIDYMDKAKDIIVNVKNQEEFAYDNMPENLQYSDRGCNIEDNINNLDEISEGIDEIISTINDIIYL